jgi:hypothetical protein
MASGQKLEEPNRVPRSYQAIIDDLRVKLANAQTDKAMVERQLGDANNNVGQVRLDLERQRSTYASEIGQLKDQIKTITASPDVARAKHAVDKERFKDYLAPALYGLGAGVAVGSVTALGARISQAKDVVDFTKTARAIGKIDQVNAGKIIHGSNQGTRLGGLVAGAYDRAGAAHGLPAVPENRRWQVINRLRGTKNPHMFSSLKGSRAAGIVGLSFVAEAAAARALASFSSLDEDSKKMVYLGTAGFGALGAGLAASYKMVGLAPYAKASSVSMGIVKGARDRMLYEGHVVKKLFPDGVRAVGYEEVAKHTPKLDAAQSLQPTRSSNAAAQARDMRLQRETDRAARRADRQITKSGSLALRIQQQQLRLTQAPPAAVQSLTGGQKRFVSAWNTTSETSAAVKEIASRKLNAIGTVAAEGISTGSATALTQLKAVAAAQPPAVRTGLRIGGALGLLALGAKVFAPAATAATTAKLTSWMVTRGGSTFLMSAKGLGKATTRFLR